MYIQVLVLILLGFGSMYFWGELKKTRIRIKKLNTIIKISENVQVYIRNMAILQEYLCDVALIILQKDKTVNEDAVTLEQLNSIKLKNCIGQIFSEIIHENSDNFKKKEKDLYNFVENLEQNYDQVINKEWYEVFELPKLYTYNFEKGKERYPQVLLLGIKDIDEYSNKRVTITTPPSEFNYSNINSLSISNNNDNINESLQSIDIDVQENKL